MEVKIGQKFSIDEAFSIAIEEAKKGLGFVAPNPPVGCVVLDKEKRFLSKGFHKKWGGPHAEVEALNQIDDKSLLEGATVIVTLEPCSHYGKTPPCAELLSKFPLSEVHYGLKDPNPLVSGGGIQLLERAGIKVFSADLKWKSSLEELMEIFFTHQRHGECFVGLKVASSLDGKMSLANGESQWITGEKAREQGHRLRALYGAILTTARSILRDGSKLNARVFPFEQKNIPVFLLDRKAQTAVDLMSSPLLTVREASDVYIFTKPENISKFDPAFHILPLSEESDFFNLKEVFQKIKGCGFSSILVEAGPQLCSALISQGLFHRLELFMGHKILGEAPESSWTKGLNLKAMSEALTLDSTRVQTLEGDIWISGRHPKSYKPLFL